jgi:peptide/nickel transport system permease protein
MTVDNTDPVIDRDSDPKTEALAAQAPRKRGERIPVISQLRQSVGLQRGMLVTGLVSPASSCFADPRAVIAPYGAQQAVNGVNFGTQQPPSATNLLGTTVGGFDVLSRVIWGSQTALLVIVAAIACRSSSASRSAWSPATSAAGSTARSS